VRDNGRGIESKHLEKIFDLFTQVETETSSQYGGLGVGLALVRRVVELHGGTVRAKSDGLGRGSEFILRLPLPLEQLELVADRARAPHDAPQRHRVLVVDDNKDAADSLHMVLQVLGQDVYTVYDGWTALEAAERLRPHLVMLDIGMPGMSGYEVAAQLRTKHGADAPRLAAITGWGQEADKREAQDRGFDYHFTKPVSAAVLHELLTNLGRSPRERD
jgi:CheY-like chemotaxis protein